MRIPIIFILIGLGGILFVICLSTWRTEEGQLFTGIFFLYAGGLMLFMRGNKEKSSTMYGLRFRQILIGITGVIVGILFIVGYFKHGFWI
jgi:hypothetical protein